MTAYYNEIDPGAAAWLRELIKAGAIAPGEVDERSIEDVRPADLRGFRQHHFFAGIGVWSYALRLAGWPDDRPVWTGSCPCQPFSNAGKRKGLRDERHLWPVWRDLIREFGPEHVFGEQVATKDAEAWIDAVQDDLEAMGYALGAVPFPAASVGAPHIRDRLYFVAVGMEGRLRLAVGCGRAAGRLADANHSKRRPDAAGWYDANRADAGWAQGAGDAEGCGESRRLGDASLDRAGQHARELHRDEAEHEERPAHRDHTSVDAGAAGADRVPGPTNGFWGAADWLLCRDPDGPRWRPAEPGSFPLAHGAAARMGRLRGYGNALNAEQARAFIEAFLDIA